MSPAREGSVLLGALLDRMGAKQSQALLARLDHWLAHECEKPHTRESGLDPDQDLATQAPYDRRKRDGNGIRTQHSNAASLTPRDRQS
jgi:hypothetical protein